MKNHLPPSFLKNRLSEKLLDRNGLFLHEHDNSTQEEDFTEIATNYDCNHYVSFTDKFAKWIFNNTIFITAPGYPTRYKIIIFKKKT